ncbi:hypothetical protein [Tenacibaculum finnmarkense]|uniref:hypothetical protein n=1 Tax=Tenacibaculum finnmarkense TaxID=2781243 RepID=UPI000C635FD0|nr:hypothetical protein [Tenacibaculum finnmarkense]MCD8440944.1 hypothetical protein [Tenacibaculum finnmarkense genomovar ulcerans]MCG8721860.1 hypothetical protein [Tenacibaculum finnmarkense]SOS56529.1 hypothetical protein TFHFJT_910003 [Tenacibaculum finnmarkense]
MATTTNAAGVTKKEVVGKLVVKANDRTHRKTKKNVFVQIKTRLPRKMGNVGKAVEYNTTNLKKYLRQALIDVHVDSATETLDLASINVGRATANAHFNSRQIRNGEILSRSTAGLLLYYLKEYLKQYRPLEVAKYDDYFKVFIFDEKGYDSRPGTNKTGFASPGKPYTS